MSRASSFVNTLDFHQVFEAANRLKGIVRHTPVIKSEYFSKICGCNVFFKCENLQKTGVFKYRGASNAMLQMPSEISSVITHSSGNHALALSKAAQMAHKTAYIVMPSNSPQIKRNAVEEYGGQITLCEPALREETCARMQAELSAEFVHPSNNENVIYGQGSIGIELLQDIPDLDCVLVPVGGGGMISGIALSMMNYYKFDNDDRHRQPRKKPYVIGCEPLIADDAFQSKLRQELVIPETPSHTIADGLRTHLGSNTFPIVADEQFVEDIFVMTEDEIVHGMKTVFERSKMVIEPSAGVGPAVLMQKEFHTFIESKNIQNIGVVLCGGNVDLAQMKNMF